ncbi:MAG TPA: mycothiol synthase [Acidimicrobiales bacterium]
MSLFEVVHRLDQSAVLAVRELAAAVAAADGHAGIDEHRLALAARGDAAGFVATLAWDDARSDLVGYVQALRGQEGWDVERMVAPDHRHRDPQAREDLPRRLLKATLDAISIEDGSEARLWAYGAHDADDRVAASVGLHLAREIRQMRRPLPLTETTDLETRAFVIGEDEAAWLRVNNRAFAWHPDQGGWTLADVEAREQEPWFDPAGFLLHERDGELAGFCWTKVHADIDPPIGEIYVIAVDPDWHRSGLGRALVVAGLDHLARAGLTVGMLYVESTNTPAVRLYEDMGFTVHHVDRMYRSLAPTG